MSLARLWRSQGKTREAYELLGSVYGRFTEGFDTTDLRRASRLLGELTEVRRVVGRNWTGSAWAASHGFTV